MEYIQENERTPKKDEGGINLRDVVELIIANWYWPVRFSMRGISLFLCTDHSAGLSAPGSDAGER